MGRSRRQCRGRDPRQELGVRKSGLVPMKSVRHSHHSPSDRTPRVLDPGGPQSGAPERKRLMDHLRTTPSASLDGRTHRKIARQLGGMKPVSPVRPPCIPPAEEMESRHPEFNPRAARPAAPVICPGQAQSMTLKTSPFADGPTPTCPCFGKATTLTNCPPGPATRAIANPLLNGRDLLHLRCKLAHRLLSGFKPTRLNPLGHGLQERPHSG